MDACPSARFATPIADVRCVINLWREEISWMVDYRGIMALVG
jgi:hypothetical protein